MKEYSRKKPLIKEKWTKPEITVLGFKNTKGGEEPLYHEDEGGTIS